MRVVIVNDFAYPEGGSTKVALQQADALKQLGCEVVLFAGRSDSDALYRAGWLQSYGHSLWSTEQYELMANPNRLLAALRGLWNFTAARQLRRFLKSYDPKDTVVLFHGWNKILTASVVRTAWKMGFPMVTVLHDYSIACPNGTYHDFQLGKHCTKVPMSVDCVTTHCDRTSYAQKIWRVLRLGIQRRLAGLPGSMSAMLFVSDYQGQVMRGWLEQSRCRILRNYVAPENLRKSQSADTAPAAADHGHYLFAGRLSSEKGGELFAGAARSAGVIPVFIGDGPERARILKTNPDARILGWQDADTVYGLMKRARALVFPSLLHESFGLAVYEAAAMGVPAIVPDQCAVTDFVSDGVNGLVYATGDMTALASCLARLEGDDVFRAELGAGASRTYADYARQNQDYGERLRSYLARVFD